MGYRPIQIPFILNETFKKAYRYQEIIIPELADFVICMWTMEGVEGLSATQIKNVIVTDGCIDLVVDYTHQRVVFSGMSEITHDVVEASTDQYFGFRMKPGALESVFGIDPSLAMDKMYPFNELEGVFEYGFEAAQESMLTYLKTLTRTVSPAMILFDTLYEEDTLNSVPQVAHHLAMSVRQTHRYFMKYYGIGPKVILDVIRFQKSLLYLLQEDESSMTTLALASGYYDQAHFSRDIKKNMGISPRELIRLYQNHDRNIQEF